MRESGILMHITSLPAPGRAHHVMLLRVADHLYLCKNT